MGKRPSVGWVENMEIGAVDRESDFGADRCGDLLRCHRYGKPAADLDCKMRLVAEPLAGDDLALDGAATELERMRTRAQSQLSALVREVCQSRREIRCGIA